jgi:DNA-binding MarR family transcriptional regulator
MRTLAEPGCAIDREQTTGRQVHEWLETLGISLLHEWDLLVFIYHHRISLVSSDQMARVVGCESTIVDGALARLERENLIKRSPLFHGVRLHRCLSSDDSGRRSALHQLLGLSGDRTGRLLLTTCLSRDRLSADEKIVKIIDWKP